jgi:hypothetical protein
MSCLGLVVANCGNCFRRVFPKPTNPLLSGRVEGHLPGKGLETLV